MEKEKDPYKFFHRKLDIDLDSFSQYLIEQYKEIEYKFLGDEDRRTTFDYTESSSTMLWNKYNLFQFYNPQVRLLLESVRDMVVEACEYYEIDFKKEMYMAQSWFNVTTKSNKTLDWHEHSPNGNPDFHGYFCVSAEPSKTFYNINDQIVAIENTNNVAILGETGRSHAVENWTLEYPRITIAYDALPMKNIVDEWKQHWIPLL